MSTDEGERYGRIAYEAYGDQVGWVVFSGAPMPRWDETLDRIRAAWRAAGQKVAEVATAEAVTAPIHIYLDGKQIYKSFGTINQLRARVAEAERLAITPSRLDGATEQAAGPVTFTINGKPITMTPRPLSYAEIATLAGIDPARNPTVTFAHAAGQTTPEGSLVRGEWVAVAEGTDIDCVVTGNA